MRETEFKKVSFSEALEQMRKGKTAYNHLKVLIRIKNNNFEFFDDDGWVKCELNFEEIIGGWFLAKEEENYLSFQGWCVDIEGIIYYNYIAPEDEEDIREKYIEYCEENNLRHDYE